MKIRKKKMSCTQEVKIPLADLSVEDFKKIIQSGCIEGEVPFDLLAEHYPELLSEWYPGYPGVQRMSTKDDPFPARARVQNGMMTLDLPGFRDTPRPVDADVEDGFYDVWLKKGESGEWTLHGTWRDADDKFEISSFRDLVVSSVKSLSTRS